jgi:hypothetical protein
LHKVVPCSAAAVVGGCTIWFTDGFGEEASLDFAGAGFSNPEEILRFLGVGVRSVSL